MTKEFKDYLRGARLRFVLTASEHKISLHKELRTEIDSFLIAFDQAVDELENKEKEEPQFIFPDDLGDPAKAHLK